MESKAGVFFVAHVSFCFRPVRAAIFTDTFLEPSIQATILKMVATTSRGWKKTLLSFVDVLLVCLVLSVYLRRIDKWTFFNYPGQPTLPKRIKNPQDLLFFCTYVPPASNKIQLSNEKKGPWLFRVFLGMRSYPTTWGLFHKPWFSDPVIKQPGWLMERNRPGCLYSWLMCRFTMGFVSHPPPVWKLGVPPWPPVNPWR